MKLSKKLIALLLMTILVLSLSVSASAEGSVSLDVFTDPNFRAVMEGFDTDTDGSLSETELAAVTALDLSAKGITSLAGLENLTELKALSVSGNPLTAIDVSKNTKLEALYVDIRQITSLDLTGLNELHKAYVKGAKADTTVTYLDEENNEKTYTLSTYTLTEGEKTLTLAVTDQAAVKSDCVWDEGLVDPQPTCTEKGTKTFTCSICGNTRTEDVDPLDHDWDEGEVTTAATCTEKGVKTFHCKREGCTETKTEEIDIDPNAHQWGEATYTWSEDNKSCTAERVCALNGEHKETETVEAAETVTKPATCTEEGTKDLKASFTNTAFAEQTKTGVAIEKLAHQFEHGRCKVCDEIDPDFKPTIRDDTRGRASWGTNYVMYSDALYEDFQKVLIDGRELSPTNYTVTEKDGTICVTLRGDYIRRLKVGDHKFSIVAETGTGEITVNISSKPKTGDENSIGLWIGILAASAVCLGGAAFFILRRNKKDK